MNDALDRTAAAPAQCRSPELSVVVPTFKERANIAPLVARLDAALAGIAWEVIFVDDDSPDGTAAEAKEIGHRDPRVRCIRRIHRRGLAGACIEGMLASQAQFVAVMDADLQHDETLLRRMVEVLRGGERDLVVASRYGGEGDAGGLASAHRERLSSAGTRMVQRLLGVRLNDPLSGFFALRRDMFDRVADRLSADGFKILIDLVLALPRDLRIGELEYRFRERLHGESKLDARVLLDFAALLASRLSGGLLPQRFVQFCAVGLSGIVVHLAVLRGLNLAGLDFTGAQAVAALFAIASNFWLNNILTYRDRRLRGAAAFRGLILFVLICSFGFISNVSIAEWIFHHDQGRWLLAGFTGAAVSAVWNYAVSARLIWRI